MDTALTLSQFSRYVAQAISRQPVLLGAWVTAEISDMSMSGGHCYMTLLEKDEGGTTIARMRATIWASTFLRISDKFLLATGRRLANGMKVMLYGGANYHINYGLSFNVGEIDPSYTMGDLERIRREILMALRKEGVLDLNRRLCLPEPPLRVAVISSERAAGYGDFINQLHHNPLGVEFNTFLFPAVMQGERTARSVAEALQMVEASHPLIGWDCVVIIRGGGATTDMTGFDDLDLARRVATFPLPVVVGIGHERDRCVLDEIACVRCKTPTAAAAWLIDTVAARWQSATDLAAKAASYASERLRGEQIRLQGMETMIPAAAEARINHARLRLQSISARLPLILQNATAAEKSRIDNVATTLRMASGAIIDRGHQQLSSMISNLHIASLSCLDREKTTLDNLDRLVDVLNPSSTLRRGYSITRLNGKALLSASDVAPGDTVETLTASGSFLSQVK